MHIYKLSFLKGTLEYILEELDSKFPDIVLKEKTDTHLQFESEIGKIEEFRELCSPISIENDNSQRIDLSKREWRVEFVPAGINPSLAYVMCMIAKLKEQDILLDSFCGSSVLPITALKYFNIKRAICSDISNRAIEKSKENFLSADIDSTRYKVFRSDIKDLKLNKRNIDVVISNLPFGIRVGSHDDNMQSYIALESVAQKLLRRQGRLVLLTQEKNLLREVFKKDIWVVKSVLRVDEGGLLPEVFLINRR